MNKYELKQSIEILLDSYTKLLVADKDSLHEYMTKELKEEITKLKTTLELEQQKSQFLLAKIDRISAELDTAELSDFQVRVNVGRIINEISN